MPSLIFCSIWPDHWNQATTGADCTLGGWPAGIIFMPHLSAIFFKNYYYKKKIFKKNNKRKKKPLI